MKSLKISLLAALVAMVSASAHAEYKYRVPTKGVKSAIAAPSAPSAAPSLQGKVSTVSTTATPFAAFLPHGAVYDPTLNSILTTTFGSALLQTSLDTGVVTSRTSLDTSIMSLAISPSGTLYAAKSNSQDIFVIDKNTWTTTTLMTMDYAPEAMAWSRYDSKLYVLARGILYKVDVAAKTFETMTLPPGALSRSFAVSATTGNIFLLLDTGGPYQVTQAGIATPEGCAGDGMGFAADPFGNVFFGGYGTHKVTRKAPDGTCAELAGSGVPGYDDGIGAAATIAYPALPMVTPDGKKVYVLTDGGLLRVIE
jgi:DNA-binding beta-propeller fold protein YncE